MSLPNRVVQALTETDIKNASRRMERRPAVIRVLFGCSFKAIRLKMSPMKPHAIENLVFFFFFNTTSSFSYCLIFLMCKQSLPSALLPSHIFSPLPDVSTYFYACLSASIQILSEACPPPSPFLFCMRLSEFIKLTSSLFDKTFQGPELIFLSTSLRQTRNKNAFINHILKKTKQI